MNHQIMWIIWYFLKILKIFGQFWKNLKISKSENFGKISKSQNFEKNLKIWKFWKNLKILFFVEKSQNLKIRRKKISKSQNPFFFLPFFFLWPTFFFFYQLFFFWKQKLQIFFNICFRKYFWARFRGKNVLSIP